MIQYYYDDIQKCFKYGCYLAALHMALSMPDYCAKVMFPEIRKTTDRYIKFIDETLTPTESCGGDNMPYLDGEIIYQIRCSLLHDLDPVPDFEKLNFSDSPQIKDFKIRIDSQVDIATSEGEYEYSAYRIAFVLSEICYHYYLENKDKFKNRDRFIFITPAKYRS